MQTFAVLGLSGGELIMVLAAILILFGAKKIPDFAKGLGQGIKEFKKASREVQDEIERAGQESQNHYTPPPPQPPPQTQPQTQGQPALEAHNPATPGTPVGYTSTPSSTEPKA